MSEAIGTREFAEKYGVTQATVSKWCREGSESRERTGRVYEQQPHDSDGFSGRLDGFRG